MDERGFDTNSNEVFENILKEDNIEGLLMSNYDADIPLDRNHNVGDYFMSKLCQILTTNYGKLDEVVDEETEYGRKFGKINISGRVLMNKFVTLLARKKPQIKGSSVHICFVQRCCVTIRGL